MDTKHSMSDYFQIGYQISAPVLKTYTTGSVSSHTAQELVKGKCHFTKPVQRPRHKYNLYIWNDDSDELKSLEWVKTCDLKAKCLESN